MRRKKMSDKKRRSLTSSETRLTKKGELLVNSAKRITKSSDPVNVIASLIQYHRLAEKMYREHMKIK